MITCEVEVADPAPSTKPPIAIDRGVALLLADSNRGVVENPRHAAALQQSIARAQRTVARRKKGSNNQKKAGRRWRGCNVARVARENTRSTKRRSTTAKTTLQ